MIKVYKIKIGDKVYEVEVESVNEKDGTIDTSKPKETKDSKEEHITGTEIEAPMQGLIVSVDVNVGTKVKAGDTIAVLEAMKMENPIVAPKEGVISEIKVKKGDTVDGGAIIAILG